MIENHDMKIKSLVNWVNKVDYERVYTSTYMSFIIMNINNLYMYRLVIELIITIDNVQGLCNKLI